MSQASQTRRLWEALPEGSVMEVIVRALLLLRLLLEEQRQLRRRTPNPHLTPRVTRKPHLRTWHRRHPSMPFQQMLPSQQPDSHDQDPTGYRPCTLRRDHAALPRMKQTDLQPAWGFRISGIGDY
jgi:hypothetical protein